MTRMMALLDRAIVRAFEAAFDPWMRRRVRVRVAPLPSGIPRDGPLLLVANHVSWWDGFVLRVLLRSIRPGAMLHTVVLERELLKHPFLRRLGGVGIDPDSPGSIMHAFRLLTAIREQAPDSAFAYFPQGRIVPSHARPLGFRRGLDRAIKALEPVTVLPIALHFEPLTRVAPTAFLSVGAPMRAPTPDLDYALVQETITRLLDQLLAFVAEHGEHADDAWVHHAAPEPARRAGRGGGR